ncbi:hypothetical protein GCM10010405_52550 [Streptomyces macrosporus]|uniref:Uncharacterized protein n=1 Tax=Streptomyces macrosporus TaxID=44032 RepID=A0ABN3KJL5_9ACTN
MAWVRCSMTYCVLEGTGTGATPVRGALMRGGSQVGSGIRQRVIYGVSYMTYDVRRAVGRN